MHPQFAKLRPLGDGRTINLVVIADNCIDATAEQAKNAGAAVIVPGPRIGTEARSLCPDARDRFAGVLLLLGGAARIYANATLVLVFAHAIR
jgi:hypothetical protein